MVVPLLVEGGVTGVLHVGTLHPHPFDQDEVTLLQLVADRVALAIAHARLYAEAQEEIRRRRRVEEELRLQARVLEHMTEGVSLSDQNGVILYTNPAEDAMFGYERGELLGKHVTVQNDYPPEENHRRVGEVIQHLSAEGAWSGEWRNRKKDGTSFTTYARITALEIGGRPHWVCVQEDITERKHAEEELRRQSELTRTIAENTTAALFMIDTRGRCTYMNPAAEAMTGYTLGELREMPLHDAIHHTYPDGRPFPIAECPIDRALPEKNQVRAHEDLFIRKNGSFFPVVCAAEPIIENGQPVGTVVEVRDVTEEKHAQQALRESEERFRTLAEALPQIVWVTRPDGWHEYYNRRWYAYTGLSEVESIGRGWAIPLHPEDRARSEARWRQATETGELYEIEYRLRDRNGEYRWFLGRALPVRDAEGRITRWFGTCTDIHDQKQAQEQLRESDRQKDEFLAMLAHELRNPLAPVLNAVQVLNHIGSPEPREARQRAVIDRQSRHMARLLDDLLDVSRITQGKIELRKHPVELGAVVDQVVDAHRALLDQRGHTLAVSVPPEPFFMEADATRLHQVIGNLLNNAAKYTPSGGQVALSLEREGREAVIRVRDNGAGIAPAFLPRVFDLFAQGDRSLARPESGLGIGLTMVRRLVELHGGSVAAHSEGPGRGSEFVVRLPLEGAPLRVAPPAPLPHVASEGAALRVLVVDDNRDAAETLSDLATLWGCEVRTAHDGEAALRIAEAYRPQVVLLDISMPGMDGYEVARRLRRDESSEFRVPGSEWGNSRNGVPNPRQDTENSELRTQNSAPLLVALTGYGQEEDRRRSREAGFDEHLTKPVDPEALRGLLAGCGTRPEAGAREAG